MSQRTLVPQPLRRLLAPALIGGNVLILAVGAIVAAVHDFPIPGGRPEWANRTIHAPLHLGADLRIRHVQDVDRTLIRGTSVGEARSQTLAAGYRPATDREVEQTAGIPVLLLSPRCSARIAAVASTMSPSGRSTVERLERFARGSEG